ncbi:MAG: tetratricopeptide repeat protein [Pyrinomonadaceae bacterium]
MNKKALTLSLIAVLISFLGGFLLANALNKNELDTLRGNIDKLKKTSATETQTSSETTLSDEELRGKISEADQNPTNLIVQRSLGLALYRYALLKQDTEILLDVARLLMRVYEKNSNDFEVTTALGNVYFDIGYFRKDDANFQKAREFYGQALRQKPNNADIRTDFGLTYFLLNAPEYEKAIAEFKKALQINPKHEKTLQVISEAFLAQNKFAEAEKNILKLREVNANNPNLADLNARMEEGRISLQKK